MARLNARNRVTNYILTSTPRSVQNAVAGRYRWTAGAIVSYAEKVHEMGMVPDVVQDSTRFPRRDGGNRREPGC
jgi:hypothetical protein